MWWTRKDIWFTAIIGIIMVCCATYSAKTAKIKVFPTQTEIQTILVEAGYDIGPKGIDGKIGKDSRLAWDKYIMEIRYDNTSN